MASDHDRYDELAVGYALGGLREPDASRFRTHLPSCQDCRRRVAELRGIAAELGDVERDERSRSGLRTQVARRDETTTDSATPTRRLTVGHVTVATVVVLLIAAGVGFWNLHLRGIVDAYESMASAQADALREFATGVVLTADYGNGIEGLLVGDGEEVALTVSGLEVGPSQSVVVWRMDRDGEFALVSRTPGDLVSDGNYATVVDIRDATELSVSVEPADPPAAPTGPVVVRTRMEAAGVD